MMLNNFIGCFFFLKQLVKALGCGRCFCFIEVLGHDRVCQTRLELSWVCAVVEFLLHSFLIFCRKNLESANDHPIGPTHYFAKHLITRIRKRNHIAFALAHLLAGWIREEFIGDHELLFASHRLHEVAPGEHVERLVIAPHFPIHIHRHAVIPLHEWVHELVEVNRLVLF